ncbi:MAG TPA: protein kinase [Candidatus Accumulibacter phosphatis]|mgnify:CR=1 FL=1|nr:protein kinase [Candidatus Accumulibacter phosphatis]
MEKSSERHFKSNAPAFKDLLDVWKTAGKPVVVWAGAGLSMPSRLPSWTKLKTSLELELQQSIVSSCDKVARARRALLQSAKSQASMWKAFELLEEGLGKATMQATINRELREALRCQVPAAYGQLWDLRIKGLLTLNIDRFAYRAFQRSAVRNEPLQERSGFELRSLIGAIARPDGRFIANLHGQIEDPINWVFTEKKLNSLLSQAQYTEFVRDCIKYSTIVLVGVSAGDRAVIDHFKRARQDLLNFGPHFWVSDTDDFDIISSVEASGIQVITYRNSDDTHSEFLEIIKDLRQFTPSSPPAAPVLWGIAEAASVGGTLPPAAEMMTRSPNQLREQLNAEAKRILSSSAAQTNEEFLDFCRTYARPIHAASYFETAPEAAADAVLGYSLISYQKEGGFAKVWRGQSHDGTPVAIKAFRYEIREQPCLLDAFRRGVRSMRFLASRQVQGIVKFLAASEIPPVVVMEWVEGATLHDVVTQGGLTEWHDRLRVLHDLAKVIYAAHNSPERVLHRDLRPQNIMLRDYYTEPESADIVVLDFDLSWHVGALEKSVYVSGGTAYLAPEQLAAQTGATTRSAAVDSFGLGMTAYFMLSKSDPTISAHVRQSWESDLKLLAAQHKCREWRSLPSRMVRLILACTKHQQNYRMSFSQVVGELEMMRNAIDAPAEVIDPRMIAEEVFARTELLEGYEIDDGWPRYKSHSGLTVEARPLVASSGLRIVVHFMQRGHEKYQGLFAVGDYFKIIPTKVSKPLLTGSECRISGGDFMTSLDFEVQPGGILVERLPRDMTDVLDKLIGLISQ